MSSAEVAAATSASETPRSLLEARGQDGPSGPLTGSQKPPSTRPHVRGTDACRPPGSLCRGGRPAVGDAVQQARPHPCSQERVLTCRDPRTDPAAAARRLFCCPHGTSVLGLQVQPPPALASTPGPGAAAGSVLQGCLQRSHPRPALDAPGARGCHESHRNAVTGCWGLHNVQRWLRTARTWQGRLCGSPCPPHAGVACARLRRGELAAPRVRAGPGPIAWQESPSVLSLTEGIRTRVTAAET